MPAFSRTIWGRRFPQVNAASLGSGAVLTGDSIGSVATTETRRFPQHNSVAPRALYPRCYGTSAGTSIGGAVGARTVKKDKFNTIVVFGV